ncbi:MAG: OmpA family protein [Bacteroidales bacterium]|nr:OmpA family protein [Candidatus Egerieousia equi]
MKKMILAVAMLFICAATFAQEPAVAPANDYESEATFGSDWFIGVQGGMNNYWNEYFEEGGFFKKHTGFAADIYVGHWFTPAVGARIGYTYAKAKGYTPNAFGIGTDGVGYYTKDGQPIYNMKFNLNYIHADLLWNLTKTISHGEYRRVDFIPYATIGAVIAGGNDKTNKSLGGGVGLLTAFKVSKRVALTLDLRNVFCSEKLDDHHGKRDAEFFSTAMVGLQFNIGRQTYRTLGRPVEPTYQYIYRDTDTTGYLNRIKDLEDALAAEKANIKTKTEYVNNGKLGQAVLFFHINKAKLTDRALVNLDDYVKNALENDPNKVFTIVGSADKQTGNAKSNMKLAQKRCDAVAKVLMEKYNVKEENINKVAEGDTNNVYPVIFLNRCAVVK